MLYHSDDSTVSFVFGLEINWDLLQLREEETKEENELRKQQNKKDLEELNERRRKLRLAEAGDRGEEDDNDEEGDSEGEEGNRAVEQPVPIVKESKSSRRGKTGKDSGIIKGVNEEAVKGSRKGKAGRKSNKSAESELVAPKKKKSSPKSGRIDEVIEIFDDEVDCSGGVRDGTAAAIDISNRHWDKAKAAGCATSSFVKDYAEDDDYVFDDEFHDWTEQPAAVADSHGQDEEEEDEEDVAPCAPASNNKASLGSSAVSGSDLKKLRSKRRIIDDDEDEEAGDCDLGPSVQSTVLLDITNKVVPASPLPKKKKSAKDEGGENWICSKCTFINEGKNQKRSKCTLCG